MILLVKVYDLEQRQKLEEHYYKYNGNGYERDIELKDIFYHVKQLRSFGLEKVEVIF